MAYLQICIVPYEFLTNNSLLATSGESLARLWNIRCSSESQFDLGGCAVDWLLHFAAALIKYPPPSQSSDAQTRAMLTPNIQAPRVQAVQTRGNA